MRHAQLVARFRQSSCKVTCGRPRTGPKLDEQPVEQDVDEGGVVALVLRGLLRFAEPPPRPIEVVDVAEPLAELVHDAVVDCGRRSRTLEYKRALCSELVVAVADEEVDPHQVREREREEARVSVHLLERLDRLPRGRRRTQRIDGACPTRENCLAAGPENRIASYGDGFPRNDGRF